MSELLAALHMASGLETFALIVTGGQGAATEPTVASLKDSNDATGGFVEAFDTGQGSVTWDFRATLDSLADAPIEFLRVRVRGETFVVTPTGSATFQPFIGATPRGSPVALTSPAWTDTDFATDPADGQPWTAAKVNALKFGWRVVAVTEDQAEVHGRVVEYTVEAWGPSAAQEGLGQLVHAARRRGVRRWKFPKDEGNPPAPEVDVQFPARPRRELSDYVKFELGHRAGVRFDRH